MSEKIGAMATQVERLAAALSRVRSTPAKVEVLPKPTTDKQAAGRRNRLEDPQEIKVLRRRLGI